MGTEFERSRHSVCGRQVTITSWYDSAKRTWAAGAPNYSHVFSGQATTPRNMPSRSLAVAAMVKLLASHLGPSSR